MTDIYFQWIEDPKGHCIYKKEKVVEITIEEYRDLKSFGIVGKTISGKEFLVGADQLSAPEIQEMLDSLSPPGEIEHSCCRDT